MDFETAIKKPFTDLKKLVIGIVLMIIPIVNFMSYGYIFETAKLTIKGKKTLPEWDNFGDLFVRGLLGIIIGLIYAIPVIILLIVMLVVAGGAFLASMTGTTVVNNALAPWTAMLAAFLPLAIIFLILSIFIGYITPSAILHFIKNYKFKEAFKFGSVFKKAFTGKYFKAWIVGFVISVVLSFVLSFIPFIGSPIAGFISGIIMFTLLGEAFRQLK